MADILAIADSAWAANAASSTRANGHAVLMDAEGVALLDEVHAFLGRFVVYPSGHAHVANTLWVIHAHLMQHWDSTPRLAALSAEPASGKSRLLEVTETLVPNPVAAVNVSPAYLFRKIGCQEGATILYDEIDTVFGPKAKEHEEIRGLLNAGHRRGAVAGRCVVRGKTIETEELPAYAPVALAGLGWLPDTLLSRSIIIRMRRRHADEQVEPYRRRLHEPAGNAIRTKIAEWAGRQVDIPWPELPAEIQDRNADIWEPLIAVADLVGGEWPQRARVAAVALVADAMEGEPSLGVRLLADIQTVFGTADKMSTDAILRALIEMKEAPWGDLKGKPLNDRGLAYRLKQYGIKSETIRIGEATLKGYKRTAFHDAWLRYVPSASRTSATSATSATIPVRAG